MTPVRANYRGVLVGNMGYSAGEAADAPNPAAFYSQGVARCVNYPTLAAS